MTDVTQALAEAERMIAAAKAAKAFAKASKDAARSAEDAARMAMLRASNIRALLGGEGSEQETS